MNQSSGKDVYLRFMTESNEPDKRSAYLDGVRRPEANAPIAAAMQQLRQPVIIIDDRRAILFANDAATALLRDGAFLWKARGALVAGDQGMKALSAITGSDQPSDSRIVHFTDDQGESYEFVIRRLPVFGAEIDRTMFMILGRGAPRTSSSLVERYSLTRSEADLVLLLVKGLDVSEAAERLNISRHTARKYVQSVFQKMDVNRQVDLVRRIFEDHDWNIG